MSPYDLDRVRFKRSVEGLIRISHLPESQQHNFGQAYQVQKAAHAEGWRGETPERREEREADEAWKTGENQDPYSYVSKLRPGQKRTINGKTYLSTIDGPQVLSDIRVADLDMTKQTYRNPSIANEYARQYRNSPESVEPISAQPGQAPGGKTYISDGYHRAEGAKANGLDFIKGWTPMSGPERPNQLSRNGPLVRLAAGTVPKRAKGPLADQVEGGPQKRASEAKAQQQMMAAQQAAAAKPPPIKEEQYRPPKHTDYTKPFPVNDQPTPNSYTLRPSPLPTGSLDEIREVLGRHPDAPPPKSSVDVKTTQSNWWTSKPKNKDKKVISIAGQIKNMLQGDSPSTESYIRDQGKKLSPEEADAIRLGTFVLAGADEATHHLKTATDSGKSWYKNQLAKYIDGVRHIAVSKWGYSPDVFGKPGDTHLTPNMKLYLALTAGMSNGKNPTDNSVTAYRIFDLARSANPKNPWQALPLKNPDPNVPSGSWSIRQADAEKVLSYLHNLTLPRGGEVDMDAIRRASDFLTDEHPAGHVEKVKEFLHGRPTTTNLPFGDQHAYPGSYVFGPKLGAFYQNLIGRDQYLTADVWWTRTWGRIVGGLFDHKGKLSGAPKEHQRDIMDHSARAAANHLGMSVADFQAVMWYYEKELYEAVGAKKTTTSYEEGIHRVLAEADPTGKLREALEESTAAREKGQDAVARKSRPGYPGGRRVDWAVIARRLIA